MFSLLRMDAYRLFKSTSFWVCMAVSVGIILFGVCTIWLVSNIDLPASSSGGVIVSVGEFPDEEEMIDAEEAMSTLTNLDVLTYLGNMGVSRDLLGIIIAIFAALFIAGEFETGFVKNVLTSAKNRRSYFVSKALVLLIAIVVFFLVSTVVAFIAGLVAGFSLTAVPIGEAFAWSGLVILNFWAFAMLVALFSWLSKTKTAGLLVGMLVAAGIVGGIVGAFLSLFPDLTFLSEWMLFSNWVALGTGIAPLATADIVRVACVGLGYLIIYSVLGLIVLQKKDV